MFEKRTNRNQEPEGPPDTRTDEEKLLDAVCPWRTKTYDQQLSDKQQKSMENCRNICKKIKNAASWDQSIVKWPFRAQELYKPLCFPMLDCLPADHREG